MSVHHVDVDISSGLGDIPWRFIGFYRWPETHNCHLSWRLLGELASQAQGSWLFMDNFNEILVETKMKGRGVRADWQMRNFREAVDMCGLREVPWTRYEFSYDNGRLGEDNVQNRLDRAFANVAWFHNFSKVTLEYLVREWSDHAPIKMVFTKREGHVGLGARSFYFEQFWVDDAECEEMVTMAWQFGGGSLSSKLEFCAGELKPWSSVDP